jgi:serine/threonine protein kinase
MGEVYRATDTNLKRQVAIKVLPQTVGTDPERLARFQREAEVLAALNHPNIAHIHGLEKSDGTLALVMELVEGPTLADRSARGPIPLAEALPIAKQITEALEAAHEQGIIHRDLKPANIKVRPDGTVKVLDFGLAKAMDSTGASSADEMTSPTLTAHATHMGTIIGTAAYMAPEQASGRRVDTRADIWAFGVVCFEMLTGKPLFAGETISETVAAVLRDDIDWTSLPAATPDRVRRLLTRCLHRDVKQRLQAIGEARIVLDSPDDSIRPAVSTIRSSSPSRNRRLLWWGTSLLVAARRRSWSRTRARESSYLWSSLLPGGTDILFVINPDNIASFNEAQIAVETLGRKDSREILDAKGSFPLYAASGHLVFFSGGSVRVAPFDLRRRRMTGPAVPIVEGVPVTPHTGAVQAAISASGTLVYAPIGDHVHKSTLVVVDLNGRAQPLTDVLPHYLGEMSVSSDGQRVALRSAKANDDIHVFDIPRGSLTRFTYEGGDEQNPVWTPDGQRLAYASQRGGTPTMYWKTADGNGTPEKILASQYPQRPSSFSPDGKVLVYTEVHPQSGLDIWTVRLDDRSSRQPEPFLRTPFDEDLPLFSPDGHWLAYRSNESGRMEVYVARFPGAAVKRQISADGGDQPQWAPDGKQLFYMNGNRLMSVDLNAESGLHPTKPQRLLERTFSPSAADSGVWGHTYAVFPDGKRFLFVENAVQLEVRELSVVLNWLEELKQRVPTK